MVSPGSAVARVSRDLALPFQGVLRRFTRGFGALGAFLPSPAADLSPRAVAGWLPHEGPVCSRCGAFLGAVRADACGCPACAAVRLPFDAARSLFAYEGPVRDAIRAAKYGGRRAAVDTVALRLHDAIRGRWADLFPDGLRPAVVPVPIRPWKYFRRGFNLPGLIGLALARRTGWPFIPLILRRIGESRPQAGLPLAERAENVRGAFRAAPGMPVPPAVILLDDVYTSGATAAACARALKTGGAEIIVVLTVARAVA